MLSYKLDFSSCAYKLGFVKSSLIMIVYPLSTFEQSFKPVNLKIATIFYDLQSTYHSGIIISTLDVFVIYGYYYIFM